jgi:hypothetical protein
MKLFITIFLAILVVAAAVIGGGFWAKTRIDDWEYAWRSCEDQAHALNVGRLPKRDTSAPPVAQMKELDAEMEQIKKDGVQILKLERQAIAILEQKPFGLPLTATERLELDGLKRDVEKFEATLREMRAQ